MQTFVHLRAINQLKKLRGMYEVLLPYALEYIQQDETEGPK